MARRLIPFAFVVVGLAATTGLLHGQKAVSADGAVPTTLLTATTLRVADVPTTTTPRVVHHPVTTTTLRRPATHHVVPVVHHPVVRHALPVVHHPVVHHPVVHHPVTTTTTHKPVVHLPVTTTTTRPVASSTTTTDPTTSTDPGSTTSTTTTVAVTTTTAHKPVVTRPLHIIRVGIATWYSYVPGHCASSWVPHGHRIYIKKLGTHKWISCLVTDTQPKSKDRVVDLSETQFAQLAPLARGVVRVVVVW